MHAKSLKNLIKMISESLDTEQEGGEFDAVKSMVKNVIQASIDGKIVRDDPTLKDIIEYDEENNWVLPHGDIFKDVNMYTFTSVASKESPATVMVYLIFRYRDFIKGNSKIDSYKNVRHNLTYDLDRNSAYFTSMPPDNYIDAVVWQILHHFDESPASYEKVEAVTNVIEKMCDFASKNPVNIFFIGQNLLDYVKKALTAEPLLLLGPTETGTVAFSIANVFGNFWRQISQDAGSTRSDGMTANAALYFEKVESEFEELHYSTFILIRPLPKSFIREAAELIVVNYY